MCSSKVGIVTTNMHTHIECPACGLRSRYFDNVAQALGYWETEPNDDLHSALHALLESAIIVNREDYKASVAKLEKLLRYSRKWIPVSDGLPESSDEVIVQAEGQQGNFKFHHAVMTANYIEDEGCWCNYSGKINEDEITIEAWMPLPGGYEEDKV